LYLEALGDVLKKTDEPHARWNPISGEDKHYARAVVLETVIERWEADLQRRGLGLPQAHGGRSL
jgi:polyphosphate kinase 2 (PPK2 family)